jgi:ribonuclease R
MPKKGPKINKAHRSMDAVSLANRLLRFFQKRPGRKFTATDLAFETGMNERTGKSLVTSALEILSRTNQIEADGDGFRLKMEMAYATGTIELTSSGAAYVVRGPDLDDIYIRQGSTGLSFGGDRVKVLVYPQKAGKKFEGEVVEVVSRARSRYVGEVQPHAQGAFILTDGRKVGRDFFVPKQYLGNAEAGQMVVLEFVEWTDAERAPVGKVVEILGERGEHETEIHAIMEEFGLPWNFPAEVEAEAARIPLVLDPLEIARRRDLRTTLTFTIDPVDAKDFDDALSIRPLQDGLWEVGVHIADVTYYVRPGSLLEQEAVERATSVYLVDRVVPMLPEILSNQVCSLRPREDKFTFSAIFAMDESGAVHDRWFGRTVIHSDRRFAYEEAQAVLEGDEDPLASELRLMDRMAKALRAQRMNDGAIAFDRAEVKFRLDANNQPIGAYVKEAKDSNKLIEEFMLLANREVAAFAGGKKPNARTKQAPRTMVYRIHDQPDPQKLISLSEFVRPLGYQMQVDSPGNVRRSINDLLRQVKGTPEANMLETLTVRTMAKAVYSCQNVGHYGLAFDDYTHFTSPIRRYPDMMVHRLLQDTLDCTPSPKADPLEELCQHSSQREQNAADAERSSIKYMQAVYMEQFVGEQFDGIISGVTDWGVFVEVPETACEGLVRLREFRDDYYSVDSERHCLVGERTGKEFRLGDPLRIVVKEVDVVRKTIDFGVASSRDSGGTSGGRFSERPSGRSSTPTRGQFDETRPAEVGSRWESPRHSGGSSSGSTGFGGRSGNSGKPSGKGGGKGHRKGPNTTSAKKKRR